MIWHILWRHKFRLIIWKYLTTVCLIAIVGPWSYSDSPPTLKANTNTFALDVHPKISLNYWNKEKFEAPTNNYWTLFGQSISLLALGFRLSLPIGQWSIQYQLCPTSVHTCIHIYRLKKTNMNTVWSIYLS